MISKDNVYGKIYKITNLVNGKVYIGQAREPRKRFTSHKSNALNKKSNSFFCKLQKAIRKYGYQNFVMEEICFCDSYETINESEIAIISTYNSMNDLIGYNMTNGGGGSVGMKVSEETKQKKRIISSTKRHSPESIEKMRIVQKGRIITPEMRVKISNTLRGRKQSPEIIEKRRQSLIGKKRTDEMKLKSKLLNPSGSNSKWAIKVVQLSKDGDFIKEWGSMSDIDKVFGRGVSVATRRTTLHHGYRWMKLTEYNKLNGTNN